MNYTIWQIYHDKKLIPNYVQKNIVKLNPTFRYQLLNFKEGKEIIKKNFDEKRAKEICKSIDSLHKYCHKSDLLRYCLLYLFGGVYLDVDCKPLVPFNDMITSKDIDLVCSFGQSKKFGKYSRLPKDNNYHYPVMCNNFIIALKKENSLLDDQINYILSLRKPRIPHIINCLYFFKSIDRECKKKGLELKAYKILNIGFNIYIYRETCIKRRMFHINDKSKVIINSNRNNYL